MCSLDNSLKLYIQRSDEGLTQEENAMSLNLTQLPGKRSRLDEIPKESLQRIIILREAGHSHRKIAADVGLSHGSVQRLLKREASGGALAPVPARIPKTPRNGKAALPDFQKLAKLTAKGKTVKDVWQAYAKQNPAAYSYEYFSTLFRVWLAERQRAEQHATAPQETPVHEPRTPKRTDAATPDDKPFIPRYTQDEHETASQLWQSRIDPRSNVVVLHGHSSYLKVRDSELILFDGQETRRFPKVTHNLTALAILGQGSGLTFEAVKWCESEGVGIFLLGWYGDLITVVHSAPDANIEVRRAQFTANRLSLARSILEQKLLSSVKIGKVSTATLAASLKSMNGARSVDDLLVIEAHAAIEYWRNWRFDLKYKKRSWPEAWCAFEQRASAFTKGPRRATHPVNAILNYAYSIAAAQLVRSLTTHGLDPACGFLHADSQGRYSLAYDLMELLRAHIDKRILSWVASHTWKRPDFPVTREGEVRLQPTLAAAVLQKAQVEQAQIDRCIAWLKARILESANARQ
jgi:CRISPR-associated protein Cas1